MEWVKLKVLGSGSYGVVTLAACYGLPYVPLIAIKSSILEHSSSLVKEKRILRALGDSPHVIMYLGDTLGFDYSLATTIYDLHLEYAAGGTLSHLIRTHGGCLPEHEVREYTRMILKGLCSIHSKGFVHCDLKPDNILVVPSADGKTKSLKIADFGLAKEPGEERVYGDRFVFRFRGTPIYMSPESFLYGDIDYPLDIWSLGCVVVEMLTGEKAMPTWFGDDYLSVILFFRQEPVIPDICETGKDFLRRCFDRNSRTRWTAEMLLQHPYLQQSDADGLYQQQQEERLYQQQEELCRYMVESLLG